MIKTSTFCLLLSIMVLAGCTGGKMVEEAKKVEDRNKQTQIQKEQMKFENLEEEREILEQNPVSPDEAVKNNEVEKVHVIENYDDIPILDSYTDPNDFAKYTAKVLYDFYTSQISADEYYEFLIKFGSEEMIADLPSKNDTIEIYSNLQKTFQNMSISGQEYEVTKVNLNKLGDEGNFYRKSITTNGIEYYKTTIKKEEDIWKFVEDEPSPPYDIAIEENIEESNTD